MSNCNEYVIKTLRYLDSDLKEHELEDFYEHVECCAACRSHLNAERGVSQMLRRSRPLYSAPTALHEHVSAIIRRAKRSNS
jgi:anti-sigma factor (TIGR02949 family)